MFSLKRQSKGFTIVELLIVIVVIGILAGLVITTFVGVQQKARDSERKTDVNGLHAQVEAYYAQNGFYPTFANMNDETATTGFRVVELKGLDNEAFRAPGGTATTFAAATATTTQYAYVPVPADCDNTTGNECTGYTLSADLEGESANYTKSSLTN